MQTILYVFGPFLLYAGGGIAAIYAAQAWVRKWLVPRHQLMRTELDDRAALVEQVNASRRLLTDLVLEVDKDPVLREYLSDSTKDRLYTLNETSRTLDPQRPTPRSLRG